MTDLKLNEFHDLWVSDTGNTSLESDYRSAVRQRLMIKIQLFLGEWFLNTRLGVPYYRDVLVKNPNFSLIRTIFRSRILDDVDVVAVPRMEMSHDAGARHLSLDFDAVLRDGFTIAVTYPPAVPGTPWDAPALTGAVTPAQPRAPDVTPWLVDLRLSGGDVYVSPTGDTELVTDLPEAVRQRLTVKLQLFLGEWFLNTRLGVPYYRDVLVKNPNYSLIRTLFRGRILDDADVVAVPRLELTHDFGDRRLSVDFEAIIRDGSRVEVSVSTLPDNLVVITSGDPVVTSGGDYVVVS